jgi:hypothetical protein
MDVLILDPDLERGDLIRNLLRNLQIPCERCAGSSEIRRFAANSHKADVIVAHCGLVDQCFADLALLKQNAGARVIFYCTDSDHKQRGLVTKLPEELPELLRCIS